MEVDKDHIHLIVIAVGNTSIEKQGQSWQFIPSAKERRVFLAQFYE